MEELIKKYPGLICTGHGDEWATWTYKGYNLFDTSCGQAGVYENGKNYLARTLESALAIINERKSAKH